MKMQLLIGTERQYRVFNENAKNVDLHANEHTDNIYSNVGVRDSSIMPPSLFDIVLKDVMHELAQLFHGACTILKILVMPY